MAQNDRMFAPKYTPKVIPALVVVPPHSPPPHEGAPVVVTTILIETYKGTSGSSNKATISKGKEVAKEQEQLIIEEGQKFLKLIKKIDSWVKLLPSFQSYHYYSVRRLTTRLC